MQTMVLSFKCSSWQVQRAFVYKSAGIKPPKSDDCTTVEGVFGEKKAPNNGFSSTEKGKEERDRYLQETWQKKEKDLNRQKA